MNIKEGIVVCNNSIKKNIIKNNNENLAYKFFTMQSFSSLILDSILKKAIIYLMEKYNYSYDYSSDLINYLPFVEDSEYESDKLNNLVSLKEELKSYIKKPDLLSTYMLRQNIVTFIDIDDSKENQIILAKTKKIAKEVILINNAKQEYSQSVYSYPTIELECEGVIDKMLRLNEEGIKFSSMKLMNIDSDYIYYFKRMAYTYNIPINLEPSRNLLSYKNIQKFISSMSENPTFNDCLNIIKDNQNLYYKTMALISKYNLEEECPKNYIALFKEEFKNLQDNTVEYKDSVTILNDSLYSENEYIFFMNFNLESTPKIYKDDDYLSDNDKTILNLSTSVDKNKREKEKVIQTLKYSPNIYITYKERKGLLICNPSNLIKELNLEVIKTNVEIGKSKIEDDLRISVNYDNYLKYQINDSYLSKYDVSHLKFNSYDNSFKMNPNCIRDYYKENRLKLSYSTLKKYYSCPFSYYIDNVLKLSEFEGTMYTRMGNFAHKALEKSYTENFCVSLVDEYLSEYSTSAKDTFYMEKLKELLLKLIEFNKEKEALSKLDNVLLETKIDLEFKEFSFNGIIDKLLYTIHDSKAYVVVIDYKTGKETFSLDNISDGFNLQLPVYLYLLKNCKELKNYQIEVVGIYLQKLNILTLKNDKSALEQIESSFKLQGYTNDRVELIKYLDSDFEASTYIHGMKLKKDGGFYSTVKIINDKTLELLNDLINNIIESGANNILNGVFPIAPKQLENSSPCEYCLHKDICYLKYDNIIKITKKAFEGDDNNGMD